MQPLVAQIGWTHNLTILQQCKDPLEREFYIRPHFQAVAEGIAGPASIAQTNRRFAGKRMSSETTKSTDGAKRKLPDDQRWVRLVDVCQVNPRDLLIETKMRMFAA